MEASGTVNVFSLRSEILSPLFSILGGGESGYIICGPAMGKKRLIDQMKRDDVQKKYWGEEHQPTLLVRVNSDLVSDWSDLGLYELILHALAMECGNQPALSSLQKEFTTWDTETILHHDELLALRLLQLAIQKVCQTHCICFLLDEFDQAYRCISAKAFNSLRGIRDENKYRVTFLLFLRQLPSLLRSSTEIESFHELISRNPFGLGPYRRQDTEWIIQRLEAGRHLSLSDSEREWLIELSGGQLSILQVLLLQIIEEAILPDSQDNSKVTLKCPAVYEECNRIWIVLSEEEQRVLLQFEKTGQIDSAPAIAEMLRLKGLVQEKGGHLKVFSPLFHTFLQTSPSPSLTGRTVKRRLKAFLCHSSQDQAFARMLYRKLHSQPGLAPWLDEYDLFPGDDWNYEITKTIEETDVVIVCLSRNSVTKEGYIQKEIRKVLDLADEKPEGTIFVIPVKIEECEMPRRLSQWQWLNYSDEGAFERLLLSLRKRAYSMGIEII
jgi:hypothetical protein